LKTGEKEMMAKIYYLDERENGEILFTIFNHRYHRRHWLHFSVVARTYWYSHAHKYFLYFAIAIVEKHRA